MNNYLILLRHGQSECNKRNFFTGWIDIPLSREGLEEALKANALLQDYPVDVVFTSKLMRAQMTAMLALLDRPSRKIPRIIHTGEGKLEEWAKCYGDALDFIPVYTAWELNERMYGELQGLNKAETVEKFGKDQVKIWRRSYDVPPPGGESLKMTLERCLPYYEKVIYPEIKKGKNVLVAAHGNSLRAIIMHLEQLTKEQVLELELPTGVPLIYRYNQGAFDRL